MPTTAPSTVSRFRRASIECRFADRIPRDGPVRLVLITCGGEFDDIERHYADNVIVTARPA